jgi:hypothetical protein
MIVRLGLLVILLVALLAMLGRASGRKVRGRSVRPIETARRCPRCGTYIVGGLDSCPDPRCLESDK